MTEDEVMKIFRSVIFDMDGVLIDTDMLWIQTELELFSSLGIPDTNTFSHLTASMTISETIRFWHEKHPWHHRSFEETEQMAIGMMTELIEQNDCRIEGVGEFIEKLRDRNLKIGLATNSPDPLIESALKKEGLDHLFDVKVSAESTGKGKPDPSVYLAAAKILGTHPSECVAIEDSCSGMQAAKEAGMRVIAFTNNGRNRSCKLADSVISQFTEANPDLLFHPDRNNRGV